MLTIYRASAGAGKTHKLTGEYLLLLFSQPGAYKRILAVTFTNKATDEMKGRIVEELYNLASGHKSDYVDMLSEAYKMDEEQVRSQAKKILITILHDYSAFNISTIDKFFQQTMRAFTREIGLQGGYGIEMDQDLVLSDAVDRLLAGLENPENKELLGWMLRFAEDKIEGGGEWNLRRDIMSLGSEVFKESYKAFSDELLSDIKDKKALEDYKTSLFKIIKSVEKEVRDIASEAKEIMNRHSLLPMDFKGGSRSPMCLFDKWAKGEMKPPTATFAGLEDNASAYTTKTTPEDKKSAIMSAFSAGLNDCVKRMVARFDNLTHYYTANEIVRYYYTLGILADISRNIAEYREEKNVMLIADTTELLSKVIDGSNAPFIYEKTGTRIDNYMIDEFQDTSGMQWRNFKPLVEESVSNNRDNLIVGDVKQSIYRFRNSDWKLLDEQVAKDFADDVVREETLKDNWRSCRNIVSFNNSFFTAAPFLLQDLYNNNIETSSLSDEEKALYNTRLMSAYKKSYQRVPAPFRNKDGHVRVEFVQSDDNGEWKEKVLERLPEHLEKLQDNGFELRDIAILVRTNMEGAAVAEALMAYKDSHPESPYKYDIISDDALFVSRSFVIRFMMQMLRHINNPGDDACRRIALFSYRIVSSHWERTDFTDIELEELQRISSLPLYEMVESVYRLFMPYFPVNEQVFVQAFLDMVAEYSGKESADLSRFIKWWDERGYRKTIATPDAQNAIRIMTVHKSKGLGFKAVIVPFCDWEIDHKPTKPVVLWCHPKEAPFNNLHLVPVRYGQVLAGTIFASDYFKEKLHAYIDNLNTLYVAFTRSKEELIVMAPIPKKPGEAPSSISGLLWNVLDCHIPDTAEGEKLEDINVFFDKEKALFEMGDWWKTSQKTGSSEMKELPIRPVCSVSSDNRLHLRLHGKGFFFNDERRKHGTLMHEILSAVRTSADIERAVEYYRLSGVISGEESGELIARLHKLLEKTEVASWYDGEAKVLNEVEILAGKGLSKRPDRVMIYPDKVVIVDYKFGEKEEKKYHTQVRNYIKLIHKMGYQNVEAYIWYVELDKIEIVKET